MCAIMQLDSYIYCNGEIIECYCFLDFNIFYFVLEFN